MRNELRGSGDECVAVGETTGREVESRLIEEVLIAITRASSDPT